MVGVHHRNVQLVASTVKVEFVPKTNTFQRPAVLTFTRQIDLNDAYPMDHMWSRDLASILHSQLAHATLAGCVHRLNCMSLANHSSLLETV